MDILVFNCGSSSVRFAVFRSGDWTRRIGGIAEGIGSADGRLAWTSGDGGGENREIGSTDHDDALGAVLDLVLERYEPAAVGHRVVHGGKTFTTPALLDRQRLAELAELDPLAPLHNPVNRRGIELAMAALPGRPQVAVFDTAFHASLPEVAYRYAVPRHWFEQHGVRRYGFHGISHAGVCRSAAELLGRPLHTLNMISLHLGNGASVAAVRGGTCVDTSMGMTPLEGLVMGTRCGDLDPGVVLQLLQSGLTADELERQLNHDSGLRGLAGSNDMRTLSARAEAGDAAAATAIEIFCYRARKYIGAYCAVLGRIDALVFTGGIGENAPAIRARILEGLDWMGVRIDPDSNAAAASAARTVHAAGSPVAVLVAPADEEHEIARAVQQTLEGSSED